MSTFDFNSVSGSGMSTASCQSSPLSDNAKDILRELKGLQASRFFWGGSTVAARLQKVKLPELRDILQCFFREMAHDGYNGDLAQAIERLAAVLPLERLCALQNSSPEGMLQEVAGKLREAKVYLEAQEGHPSPSLRARLSAAVDGMLFILERLISAFGLVDFFKQADSEMQSEAKSQKVMMLFHAFSLFSTIAIPTVGLAAGGAMIGYTFLGIVVLSLVYPFIKPRPSSLPTSPDNWTKEIAQGCEVPAGRQATLNEIDATLKRGRHVILVGPSRVGKTLTAKAYAARVREEKTVFRFSTAKIVDQKPSAFLGGGNDILERICEAMGRHCHSILPVFDEIHMACKDKNIADKFKLLLDKGGALPPSIGITTEDEYQEYVLKNKAFAKRFHRVTVRSTDEAETLKIISDAALKHPSHPLIMVEAIQAIYKRSVEADPTAPQPEASLDILEQYVGRTERGQKSPKEREIEQLSMQVDSLSSRAAAGRSAISFEEDIEKLETQLQKLRQEVCADAEQVQKLFQAKDLLDQVTLEKYRAVLKISGMAQKTLQAKRGEQLARFVLLHQFADPALQQHIRGRSAELGVTLAIDRPLIEQNSTTT